MCYIKRMVVASKYTCMAAKMTIEIVLDNLILLYTYVHASVKKNTWVFFA